MRKIIYYISGGVIIYWMFWCVHALWMEYLRLVIPYEKKGHTYARTWMEESEIRFPMQDVRDL